MHPATGLNEFLGERPQRRGLFPHPYASKANNLSLQGDPCSYRIRLSRLG
jgi:hypothetical protein